MDESAPAERFDVAIIGGGLVGASLACALGDLARSHGLRVVIVESRPVPPVGERRYQPSFDARASAIAYGSRRHFDRLGLWTGSGEGPYMAGEASPIRHIHVSERGRLGATRLHAAELDVEALGYVVPNAWMGQVLHQRLAALPVAWRCPASVETLTPTDGGYRLTLDDNRVLDAGLTVLADGGRSGLKEHLGIDSDTQAYDQTALIANVAVSRHHAGWAYERFTPDGPMALLPLGESRMELVWTFARDEIDAALSWSDAELLARLQKAFGDRLGRFRRVGERHAYPLSLVTARETVRPHLAVLGNAAHALHPVAGQGFNLALRGVMDLASSLEDAWQAGEALGSATTLAAFEDRRARDTRRIVRASDGLIRLFGIDHGALGHARAAGLMGLNAIGPLKRTLARQAMGIER